MNQLNFSVDLDATAGERSKSLAGEIEALISQMPQVDAASATPNVTRFTGAEVVAGIAVVVTVAQGVSKIAKTLPETTEAITQTVIKVRELIAELRKLKSEFKDIEAIRIKDGFDSIPLDDLNDDQIEVMVKQRFEAESVD